MRKYHRALEFVEKAERYAKDRRRMAGNGDGVAGYILDCAERVTALDARVLPADVREAFLARIWAAYGVVTDYLESSAPNSLDRKERLLYGEVLDQVAANEWAYDSDWDGCKGQVQVDSDYHGGDY